MYDRNKKRDVVLSAGLVESGRSNVSLQKRQMTPVPWDGGLFNPTVPQELHQMASNMINITDVLRTVNTEQMFHCNNGKKEGPVNMTPGFTNNNLLSSSPSFEFILSQTKAHANRG